MEFGSTTKYTRSLFCLILFSKIFVLVSGNDKSYRPLFQVYWNIPTFICKQFKVDFTQIQANYGIIQNTQDEFRGDRIVIFYDPGLFPSLTSDGSVDKNKGVPQLGDLDKHLQAMRKLINSIIPDRNFQGLGVLDFESWRPIWKQNWGSLLPYREYSRKIEKKNHPNWDSKKIEDEAERRFEDAGRRFMEDTLKLVKEMRPFGKWGYYAFPYCFNYTPKNMQPDCPSQTKIDNNQIQWLFDDSLSIYPSIYLSKHKLNEDERRQFVEGRLNEGARLAKRSPNPPEMYPYIWYRYYDDQDYITKNDMYNSLITAKMFGMGGAVLWGSSNDLNTKQKCERLLQYVDQELGPMIKSLTTNADQIKPRDDQTITTNYTYDAVKEDTQYQAILL